MEAGQEKSILYRAAEWSSGLELSDIPPEAVRKAKDILIDALDNFYEGTDVAEIAGPLKKAAPELPDGAPLFGTGKRSRTEDAVFYNVAVGSVTARNDHHAGANVHPGSVLVPALLGAAEAGDVGGGRFLEALVIGCELMIRMGRTLKSGSAYPPPESLRVSMLPTPLAVAFAVSKLRGLDAEKTADAAALSLNLLCGVNQWRLDGTAEDIYQNAWDTVNAMHCVRLSEAGVRGAFKNLDGPYGFLHLFGAEQNGEKLLDGLGTDYRILEINSKISGACARVLAPMQLSEELLNTPGFRTGDLKTLTIRMNRKCTTMQWYTNRHITCQSEAINSVPYAAAAVLAAGSIDRVSWFPPYDPEIFSLMEKTELVYDAYSEKHLDPDGYCFEAEMTDGTVFRKEKMIYGALSEEGILRRFRETVGERSSRETAEKLEERLLGIETENDIRSLTAALAGICGSGQTEEV